MEERIEDEKGVEDGELVVVVDVVVGTVGTDTAS